MNNVDESLASQVEAMKDDASAWGDPEPEPTRKRKSERRLRGVVVSVRLTADELAAVQKHALDHGLSVSGYLRSVALQVANRPIVSRRGNVVATNTSAADLTSLLLPDTTAYCKTA